MSVVHHLREDHARGDLTLTPATPSLPGPPLPMGSAPLASTSGFAGGLRLRLEPTRSRRAMLDGVWWPYSTDLMAELAAVVRALDTRRGPVTHLMLGASVAAEHPRVLRVDGRRVRLGWFASQSAALLIAVCGTGERTDLLVIPSAATPEVADRAMAATVDATNMLRAPDLLAAATRPGHDPDAVTLGTWGTDGGHIHQRG